MTDSPTEPSAFAPKPILTTLREMRDLLSQPDGWCQWTCARNAFRRSVHFSDESARSFCIMGACLRVTSHYDALFEDFWRLKSGADMHPAHWNDQRGRTQAEVLAMLERLISEAGAEALIASGAFASAGADGTISMPKPQGKGLD